MYLISRYRQQAGWELPGCISVLPEVARAGKLGFSGGSWAVMGAEWMWPRGLQAVGCVQGSGPA